ncbi:MAG: DNA polymerase III subunit delta' [Pseudomonadota bacterium]
MAKDDTPLELDRAAGAPHPRETSRLIGQEVAEQAFLDAWASDRLHHAWLLRGPQGIGKATLAYRMARAILAEGPMPGGSLFGAPLVPKTLDSPADCPIDQRIKAGSEPRLSVLRLGVNPSTGRPRSQIVVDDVRATKGFLQLSAADGGWRVVIVDAADQMNRSAANALLKMLEEPPELVLMILISHAPGSLLPTIRSRCRFLDLYPLSSDQLSTALAQADVEIPTGHESNLAELANGSVGRAVELINGDGLALYAKLVAMMSGGRVDRHEMSVLANQVSGRDAAQAFAMTADLLQVLVGRLARAAASGTPPPPASTREPELIEMAASQADQASLWAEASARIGASLRHSVAVNLDPGQTIIDTLLDLDTVLGHSRRAA